MAGAYKGKALSFWLRHRTKRRRKNRTASTPRSLHDVLTTLEPEIFREQLTRCPITLAQWQEAVGLRLADRSSPRRLDPDGSLLIAVKSSVWAQELSMLSSMVCQRLQSQGHDVRTVRFMVSSVQPERRGPGRVETRFVPKPACLPEDLQRDLDDVQDDALREAIRAAMMASLATKQSG
ncbi:MAG TPA: DciA family protein [Polyangiaceae bacterium]|nr:MAG: hypothetical protein BWY17_04161 [Deltaproteobacteria bacterium ADurb.Bin207]HNT00128.1 DciA family protein [Polyangiaceae bacterium]HNZ21887.1 DciA family protein [Polyangiaceae bacterium]HOD24700.1 DciA family protein [Polyangiaceae bacterium]HOE51669.1 DciA family protein [Polyangiaceae bacterium]